MQMAMGIVSAGDLDAVLWLHTESDPPQDEFTQALNQVIELKRKRGGVTTLRSLVLTDGGAPNTLQRGQVGDVFEAKVKAVAVTTVLTNRIKRGIATAVSWINPSFRAYAPEEFSVALTYLDLIDHRDGILAEFQRLQKSIPHNKTLALISKTG